MQRQFRVLLIDDEPELLEMLEMMLVAEGFDVVTAQDALAGLRAAYQAHPDIILLDVMMPNMDGFETCRRLREMTEVPILFLTGKAKGKEDVVHGFALGSRITARLRRAGEHIENEVEYMSPTGSVILNCSRHELVIGDRNVYLGPKEFDVIRLLIRHSGKVLSRNAILAQVWGPERVGEPDLVKQYIYRLRQKIEPDPTSPQFIHSVRGEGYYFDAGELL
jgi:two-component system KDP operon response regulator KdpE